MSVYTYININTLGQQTEAGRLDFWKKDLESAWASKHMVVHVVAASAIHRGSYQPSWFGLHKIA